MTHAPLPLSYQAQLLADAQAQLAARVAEHCDSAYLPWTPEPAAVADADGWVDPTRRYAELREAREAAGKRGRK